jgi:hypothetical protein
MRKTIVLTLMLAACGGAGQGSTSDGSMMGPGFGLGLPTPPMPLISRGVPAFASAGDASAANDSRYDSAWNPGALPGWIAYDLSAAPAAQRQHVLVSWYAIHAPCYIDTAMPTAGQRPIAYTIESNSAPGGGAAPTASWNTLLTIADNRYCGRAHLVNLDGANWIRLNVTQGSSDSPSVALEMDVQDATAGASDAWLFMGDSITYMTMTHAFCDLPALVRAQKPAYFPAVLDGALGGTNTSTAMLILDDTMKDYPGRFVALAYGTNDHANEFHMEELVQKVIAAGKTPVVPHMPWSSGSQEGPLINAAIDKLYAKYPAIVRGPDLWAFFSGRTDLIPVGDVHPNGAGQEELRKQWAMTMAAIDQ